MNIRGFLVGVVMITVACSAFAVGPNLMSYQGQVLTAGGAPIANSVYPASFVFFPVPVGGLPLWSEPTTISTSAGLFTHTLGSVSPIPSNMFTNNPDVWLEVTVNGQVQSPRTQLMSVGNAMAVNTVDRATGGILKSGIGVGEPMVNDGYIYLHSNYASFPTAALFDYGAHGSAFALYQQNGTTYAYTYPSTIGPYGGNFYVQNGNGGIGFNVEGNYSGGSPFVSMSGLSFVSFDLGAVANNSVNLPDSAIAAPEILDEPGVASFSNGTFMSLTTTMQDLATVTITLPSAGYIWLAGVVGQIDLCGTTGINGGYAQIDETPGGSYLFASASTFGAYSFPTTACDFESVSCQRMYFKASPGSYTFRLEVMNFGGSGTSLAAFPRLTATYFPTSYGAVVAAMSSAEAGTFESATLVKVSEAGPANVTGATQADVYMVDLRELELKVAKSRAETERLGRELAEARLKEQLNSKTMTTGEKK